MRDPHVIKGVAALVLCAMLASAIEGCTAIGFAVGARSDSRNGKGGPELLLRAKVGQRVTLLLHDGRRVEGRFLGWSGDAGATSPTVGSPPPRAESVRLASGGRELTIHSEEIVSVSMSVNQGKVTGLLVGAALDAVAVLAFVFVIEQAVSSAFGQ